MADLVSFEQVYNALRLDIYVDTDDQRVADITAKIAQASDIVLDYLKNPDESEYWTSETAPARVQAATIIVVNCLLHDDEDSLGLLSGLLGGAANLANPIVALLYRLRDPAMA